MCHAGGRRLSSFVTPREHLPKPGDDAVTAAGLCYPIGLAPASGAAVTLQEEDMPAPRNLPPRRDARVMVITNATYLPYLPVRSAATPARVGRRSAVVS